MQQIKSILIFIRRKWDNENLLAEKNHKKTSKPFFATDTGGQLQIKSQPFFERM